MKKYSDLTEEQKEKRRASCRAWQNRNKEKVKAKQKEYRQNNQPTEEFYYSNKSLGPGTTYIPCTMKEFTSSFNLEFSGREKNNGIFKKKTKTKVFRFFGKKKLIVNSPYMIEINFGDYIAISNGLIMVIPKKLYKNLFK